MIGILVLFGFVTLLAIFHYFGRSGDENDFHGDPMLDPMNNPNIIEGRPHFVFRQHPKDTLQMKGALSLKPPTANSTVYQALKVIQLERPACLKVINMTDYNDSLSHSASYYHGNKTSTEQLFYSIV